MLRHKTCFWKSQVLFLLVLALGLSDPICALGAGQEGVLVQASVQAAPFGGSQVTLTGESYWKEQLEIGAAYLKYYDVDRLAASLYENNLKSKSPAQVYGGWEGGGLPGHSAGHYLSACVSMYLQTGDEDFKKRAERMVYLIGEAQYEDGYVGGVAKSRMDNVFNNPDTFWAGGHNNAYLDGMWAPWYSIHKIYGGLIDAYLGLGNKDALRIAEGMAAYAKNGTDKLSPERMDYMLEGEYGGINESFAQLYEITGKEDYRILAERFSHKRIMDPLSRGEDNLSGLHANTQIPKIVGAAKIYQLTGDEYYKNVAENFWNYVVYHRSYATGGNCDKEFFTDLGTEPRSVDSTETCNVYNMLKLTEYLYSVDPKTEYIEYAENVLYNHILGSQNQAGDKTYNIDLTMGGHKNYMRHCQNFTCCEGTGMENPGRFYRMIYAQAGKGVNVNLFVDSRLTWEEQGIVLKQTTDFPYTEESTLAFEQAPGKELPLKIRIPKWAKGAQITINQNAVNATSGNDGYVTLTRTWKAGDTIQVRLPMESSLYVSREDSEGKIVAFRYGPILLAGELEGRSVPTIVTETRDPAQILKKQENAPLRFSIDGILKPGDSSISLKPFFEFISENYMVYWKLYTQAQYDASGEGGDGFEERLNSASYDVVYPNRPDSESAHNLQTLGESRSGNWMERGWRSAVGQSSFSYDLAVKPTSVNYLLSVFYGSEYGNDGIRTFDILVEGEPICTYTLDYNRPNDPWEYHYLEIPSRLTDGKSKITVTYRANAPGYTAGGVFEARTTSARLWPYETEEAKKEYTITYLAGEGGAISGKAIQTVLEGGSTIPVTAVPDPGCRFLKWDDGTSEPSRYETGISESKAYTAIFQRLDPDPKPDPDPDPKPDPNPNPDPGNPKICTITFHANGGTVSSKSKAVPQGKAIGKLPQASRKGYRFNGWFSAKKGGKKISESTKATNSMAVYAQWSKTAPKAPAKGTAFPYGSLKYRITKSTASQKQAGMVSVIGAKEKKKQAVIPATVTYKGYTYKVEAIARQAFQNNKKVETIRMGTNLKRIQKGAFYNCANLKSAVIGKNVTAIEEKAFMNCKKLKKIHFAGQKLKSVGANALKNISSHAKIKAPKTKLARYRKLLKKKGQKKTVVIL
ncbi:MAG: leucine-rich repeat protein [Lachnospiraceae bacterium]|nr:leucine-rich repeat protein [Lachnospiraceae bacterium]